MTRHQRTVLIVCGTLIACSIAYAPYQVLNRSLGYGWLFSPPHPYGIIDTGQLLVEWVAILLLGAVAFNLFRTKEASANASSVPATATLNRLSDTAIPIVVVLLRAVRGLFGFIAALQIFGLFPILTWVSNPGGINGEMLAGLFIKFVTFLLFGALFLAVRVLINWVHKTRNGIPHPSLSTRWSL